jgi:DNA polymerase-1
VDRERLAGLSAEFAREIGALETTIHELAGEVFTIGSPKQLGDVLFDRMGFKGGRKGKSGQYSTDQSVLEALAADGLEMATRVLEWRQLSKLRSTYTEALQAAINPDTQRVHTSYSLVGAQTGRLSSTEPNLQNIPIRTEIGRQIRDCFVAEPGHVLLSADYSQIELRLMAHVTGDPELVRAFQEGRDVHTATAAKVFDVSLDQVTAAQRRSAKTVNFAVMYGQKDFGLSRQLRIPLKEARDLIDAYFSEFPGVLQFTEATLNQARQDGYVTTLPPYRRKRYTPGIHAGNRNERLSAEREAVNAPIQGTAADVIKIAMIKVDAAMRAAGLKSRMILQVHDELLFELVPEEEEQMLRLVTQEMENAYALQVPLKVETKVGCNWRDVEPTAGAEPGDEVAG